VEALPTSAYFLFLEAGIGGTIALFLVHLRGEVGRGFTLFTGLLCWSSAALALWLRTGFPPPVSRLDATAGVWFAAERALSIAFLVLLGVYLLLLRLDRRSLAGVLGPLVPLIGLVGLWSAALVEPSPQLFELGAPMAVLAGALALGTALAGLSLGHWYLVTPSLSLKPLIRLTLLLLGILTVQTALVPMLLWGPGSDPGRVATLVQEQGLFFAVRLVFGLVVPLVTTFMTWRTARIRSLDSATGLLYIVSALVLAGEIAARALQFQTGVAT
jgi:hypothetical protein